MEIFDITLPVSPGQIVWPGDPKVELERVASMDEGAHANVSRLALSVHTGTHVDAPHHFLNDGRTVESLPLDVLVGPGLVVRIQDDVELITADILAAAGIPDGSERLLFKTRNSKLWQAGARDFFPGFTSLPVEGADWLVEHGVRLVGIDYLSISPYKNSEPTHRALLTAGIVILEGVDLSRVEPGRYDLYCLPLKLAGSDGAPARAILVR